MQSVQELLKIEYDLYNWHQPCVSQTHTEQQPLLPRRLTASSLGPIFFAKLSRATRVKSRKRLAKHVIGSSPADRQVNAAILSPPSVK
jgi:hypothetical protein